MSFPAGTIVPRPTYPVPTFWKAFGHSYIQYSFGTVDQTGRMDAIFTSMLDIERGINWTNYAVNGACVIRSGEAQGGWQRAFQRVQNGVGRGGPYAPDMGATLLVYGINDIGFIGTDSQIRNAWQHAMRAVISRMRASVYYDNDFSVGTRTSYSGFAAQADTVNTNSTYHRSTTNGSTITMTLPADYKGEPVCIAFIAGSGDNLGGTLTFSGTAGVTGTLTTNNHLPAAASTFAPVVKRITNLTAANAGQTIIATITTLNAAVRFDGWWLEAKNAPPVLVANIAKLTAAGYAIYSGWAGTETQKDADVDNFNSDLYSVVAEFDSMVQVADIDSALAKTAIYFFDGLHTVEIGSAKACDQLLNAVKRFSPTTDLGVVANMNAPAPHSSNLKNPRRNGLYYTWNRAITTAPTTVVPATGTGNLMAFPFVITSGRERYDRINMTTGATGGGTAGQFRWGLYDDPGWTGYPQCLFSEPTVGAAKSTGIVANTDIFDTITWPLDPGLYWIAFKWTVLPVTTQIRIAANQPPEAFYVLPMLNTTAQVNYEVGSSAPPCGWQVSGQGTGVLPSVFPSGATVRNVGVVAATCVPLVSLRLAA